MRGDLVLLEPLLGIGELAISDHRSSQPTFDEILRLAADAHVSGLMTGKAGVLHLHLGDGSRGLDFVRRALSESEIPARVFNPTHVNRRKALFDEAVALAGNGCYIDLTAFPVEDGEDAWSATEGLQRYLASGAPADRVTISSDAGGCLPCFDAEGRVSSMDVGHSGALLETLRALADGGMPLETALPAFTANPARLLRLARKGRVEAGADADLVALDATGGAHTVIIGGKSTSGAVRPSGGERSRIARSCTLPSIVPEGGTRGWIIPIGGAENKENDRHILERFVRVSGGRDADIVVIPTASRLTETGPRYEKLFRDIGAARVTSMDFDTRRDCHEPGRLERLAAATGIFFTGGNQLRISTLLGGTPVAKLIRVRNANGVTVGGTSAGASILSEHMIAFGDEGSSVISGSVRLAPGLGLTNRFIIDQHFRQRDRLGRLLTALAYNPFAIGIGLDEDTAAFIGPDETVEVEGSGGVMIVDASDVSFSSMDAVSEGQPVCLLGLKLHMLVAGATYNLHTRLAQAGSLNVPKE